MRDTMPKHFLPALALLLPLVQACASAPEGPVVPSPPTVEVSRYGSEVITPEVIRFGAKVSIRNTMRGPLELERVDWSVDLQGAPLFDETFSELLPMGSRGAQTVSLPFQVAMSDVTDRLEGVLAEDAVRVAFRGTVFPVGFEPIPFHAEQSIPIPKLPEVSLDGVQGSPLDGAFTVHVSVRNRNDFALDIAEVDTHVDLNGLRYEHLRTDAGTEIAPGGTARLVLAMENTKGKGLSAILNVAKSRAADVRIGGSLSCRTPYGLVYLPLELGASPAVAAAR